MLTARLKGALEQSGIAGKSVCIHASLRSFAPDKADAQMVLDSFLDAGCTVMTPVFSYGFLASPTEKYSPVRNGCGQYEWYRTHPLEPGIFSVHSKEISTEDMGAFARQVLLHPGCVRGNHPINSFAAVGKDARTLIGGQDWRHVYAPFEALCEQDGWVLLMGTDLTGATILHYAEQLSGRSLFVRWALDAEGKTRPAAVGGCSNGFERMRPHLEGIEKRITVGNSLWRLYPAREMADMGAALIRRQPSVTRCENPNCRRCTDAVQGGPMLTEDFWQ